MKFEDIYELVKKNIDYYAYYVSKNSLYSKDDVSQEITYRVWRAFEKYDSEKGSIKTYFITVIKRQVLKMISSYKTLKSKKEKSQKYLYDVCKKSGAHSCDGNFYINIIHDPNVYLDFEKRKELNNIFDFIKEKLKKGKENAYVIFSLLRLNYPLDDISKELKMSKQNICNIVRREIRPLLIKYF